MAHNVSLPIVNPIIQVSQIRSKISDKVEKNWGKSILMHEESLYLCFFLSNLTQNKLNLVKIFFLEVEFDVPEGFCTSIETADWISEAWKKNGCVVTSPLMHLVWMEHL